MNMNKLLKFAVVGTGLLAAGFSAANAQTSFRPGRDGGEFSGYESARATLDALGLANSEPENWTPLPEAREIMDHLAANGDVQDDALKNSWEEVGRMTQAIEAALENCVVAGVERVNELIGRMRQLGEELHTRASEIAEIREGVVELYSEDLALFLENVSDKPDVRQSAENLRNRYTTAQLLRVANDIIGGAGQASRAALGEFLGVVGVTIKVADGAIMSYEAFVAYNRLPHLLEKYEMISWLNALIPQYRELYQAIGAIVARTRESVRERCPCLVQLVAPERPFPDFDLETIGGLIEQYEALIRRANARPQAYGRYIQDFRNQLADLRRQRAALRSGDEARRAWSDQVEDNAGTRRRYDAYRRARQDDSRTLQRTSNPFESMPQNNEPVPNRPREEQVIDGPPR